MQRVQNFLGGPDKDKERWYKFCRDNHQFYLNPLKHDAAYLKRFLVHVATTEDDGIPFSMEDGLRAMFPNAKERGADIDYVPVGEEEVTEEERLQDYAELPKEHFMEGQIVSVEQFCMYAELLHPDAGPPLTALIPKSQVLEEGEPDINLQVAYKIDDIIYARVTSVEKGRVYASMRGAKNRKKREEDDEIMWRIPELPEEVNLQDPQELLQPPEEVNLKNNEELLAQPEEVNVQESEESFEKIKQAEQVNVQENQENEESSQQPEVISASSTLSIKEVMKDFMEPADFKSDLDQFCQELDLPKSLATKLKKADVWRVIDLAALPEEEIKEFVNSCKLKLGQKLRFLRFLATVQSHLKRGVRLTDQLTESDQE